MRSIDILKAISNIDDKYIEEAMPSVYKEEKKSFFNIKMLTSALCVLLLAVIGINVMENINKSKTSNDTAELSSDTMATNPYLEVKDMKEASEVTGFVFNTPDLDYEKSYLVIDGYISEVSYLENDEAIITLRKAHSSEDVSGVYESFETITDSQIEGVDVSININDENILITFIKDEYFYSLYSNNLQESKALEIVTYIIENN